MQPLIDIRLFGPFHIDGLPAGTLLSRHAVGLLAHLAVKQGTAISRSFLADLLWSTKSTQRARHSLSQLLYSLKAVLPIGCLHATSRDVTLNARLVNVDLTQFRDAVDGDDHQRVIQIYVGRFLDGAAYLTDEYDDWRLECAALLEAHANAACAALVAQALEEDDHERAADLAKRGLIISPENEHLARVRVESLAASGDVAKALRELELLRRQFLVATGEVPPSLCGDLAKQLAALPLLPDGRSHPGVQMRMVGRTDQIKILREHWSATRSGCRVALLYGEAGIGKTRILQHIARRTVLEGARTFMYCCAEVETRLPYSGIVGLIRDGFRAADIELLESQWQMALASFAPELFQGREIVPVVHERVLWEAVAQYFEAITHSQAVTLALDDYQWADSSSRELLIYVTRRLAERPLFMLYAGRLRSHVAAYEDERAIAQIIEVPQLTPDDVEQLIRDFERAHELTVKSSVRGLLNRIGGRPFFLREAFRQLKASGGHAGAESLSALLAVDLVKFIAARLSSTSNEARSLVAAAAILNREGSLHFLARVTELPAMAAANAAAEVIEQGILADTGNVRFAHDLMREAVSLATPYAEKIFWHARIADTLAVTESARSSEVAYHYEQAGELAQAYSFAVRAAEQALRLNAYSDAEAQFTRMLKCAPEDAKDEVYSRLVRFVAKSARYQQLLPILSEVEASATRSNDPEALLVCEIAQLNLQEAGGYQDRDQLAARAKHIVQMAEQHAPTRLASVMWQVAEHIRRSGEAGLLERFAHMLARRGRETVGETAADMLSVAALLGASPIGYRFGIPLAEEAVNLAAARRDEVVLARALFARGTLRLLSGHLSSAGEDLNDALVAVDRFSPDGLVQSIQANYAVVLMEQMKLEDAEGQAKAALREPRATRRAYSYGNLALISLRRGDAAATRHYIECLVDINSVTPQAWIPAHAQAILGLLDLEEGNSESAAARAAMIETVLDAAVEASDSSHIYLLRARVKDLHGDSCGAIQMLMSASLKVGVSDYIGGSRLLLEAARLSGASPPAAIVQAVSAILAHCKANGAHSLAADADELLSKYRSPTVLGDAALQQVPTGRCD
jgi:DNA-binding SARP family transcriptional activator